jgi:hypothetical protein
MLLLLLFLKLLLTVVNNIKKNNLQNLRKEKENIFVNYFLYLDTFFIRNKFLTFVLVIIYFAIFIGLFIYFRIASKTDNLNTIYSLNSSTINIIMLFHLLILLFKIVLFILILIMFKMLIDALIFHEILKLHIYLIGNNNFYRKLSNFYFNLHFHYGNFFYDLFGKFYLFFYNVSKLRVVSDPADYRSFNIYDNIYDNFIIQKLSFNFVNLATKSKIFQYLFKFLYKIFRFMYNHMCYEALLDYLPYILLFFSLFIDFINNQLYYTSNVLFFVYFLLLNDRLREFFYKKEPLSDPILFKYFYNNSFDYVKQKELLLLNKEKFIDVIKDSQQNRNVFYAIMNSSLLDYLNNDLIIRKTESELLVLKRLTSMYRRYIILFILFIFIVYLNIIKDTFIVYLGTVTIPINIVLFPLFFFSIFISAKTYYNFEEEDPAELEFYKYKFNKYYNLFFWLLILFQLFILCMTIFYKIMV